MAGGSSIFLLPLDGDPEEIRVERRRLVPDINRN